MTETLGLSHQKETSGYVLGWLIQNREFSDADLCTVLLTDYARPLELLAQALNSGPAEQVRMVDDTIAYVLANRRSYRSEVSGPVWLYSTALRLAQAKNRRPFWSRLRQNTARWVANRFVQGLDPGSHWAGLLNGLQSDQGLLVLGTYGLGLSCGELSQVLDLPDAGVLASLEEIRRQLSAHADTCNECQGQFFRLTDVEAGLREDFGAQAGLLQRSAVLLENWQAALLRRVRTEMSGQRGRSVLLQSAQMGLFALVVMAGIWLAGRSLPELNTRPAASSAQSRPGVALAPPTIPRAAAATPQPDAGLNPDAVQLAVVLWQARNSQHLWKSLWADVESIHYDMPVGEVVAQEPTRKQVWLQQPGLSRLVAGPLGSNPTSTLVVAAGRLYDLNLGNGQTVESNGGDLIPDLALRKMFTPDYMLMESGEYHLSGRGSVAGRPAWIVDWQYLGAWTYRFWIDERYGVILRMQTFSRDLSGELVADQKITTIYFDVDFPAAIFKTDGYNPAYFADDPSGVPELPDYAAVLAAWPDRPIQHVPILAGLPSWLPSAAPAPGPDFYPGSLSFQRMAGTSQGLRSAFELLAGGHPLGLLPSGGGNIVSCQRSSDSRMIAYTSGAPGTSSTSLYLADLMAVPAGRSVLSDGITAGDYAFSPDSSKLAFFGCDRASSSCGVYILAIPSGKLTRILDAAYADYMLWSPDGKSLALVGNQARADLIEQTHTKNLMLTELVALAEAWHFFVLDPSNGDVLYKRPFDWKTLSAPADSPTLTWATPFKLRSAGLESCMAPGQSN